MHTRCPSKRTSAILGVLLLLLAGGCEFDPARHVHAAYCPPDHTTDDGITWVALKTAGDNDEWYYVPDEIAVLAGERPAPPDFNLDVLVKGKTFRIGRSGSMYYFVGQVDSDLAANPGLLVLAVALGLAFVVSALYAIGVKGALESARESTAAAEAKASECQSSHRRLERDLQRERSELENKEREFEKSQAHEQSVLAAEREALTSQRQELEQQKNTLAVAARAIELKREPPTREEWERMGIAIRAEQFRGSGSSREVAVQYFLDPKTSGAVVFDWEITLDRPYPPTLRILRNGRTIRTEAGMFKGRLSVRLLNRTRRYRFVFKVLDGTREYPDPLLIELTAPPFDAWTEPPKSPQEQVKQSRDEWVAQNVDWLKKMGQWPTEESARKDVMAKLQAEALQKFGEAE